MGKVLDFAEEPKLVNPVEAWIPEGITNILVSVRDGKGNFGTIEVGTDGWCQAVLIIDGKVYKFFAEPKREKPH